MAPVGFDPDDLLCRELFYSVNSRHGKHGGDSRLIRIDSPFKRKERTMNRARGCV